MIDQALAIAAKDMKEYVTSKPLVFAVFVLPALVAVSVPSIIGLFLSNVPSSLTIQVTQFMPPVLRRAVDAMGLRAGLYWYLFNVVTMPLFYLLPTASVIVLAADSFAGEKERKTAEMLVSEPISMATIFVGKVLAPVAMALFSTWAAAAIYWVLAARFAGSAGVQLAPDQTWLSALLLVVPALSLAYVSLVAWISSLSKGFKEAQQLSAALILPLVAIVLGSASGNFEPGVEFNVQLAVAYFVAFVVGVLLWARLVPPRKLVE